jgi:tetratricopeptide (TPR) repeat protein
MAASERANPNERDSPSPGTNKTGNKSKPKRWYERTSVTLCVVAGFAVVGSGFLHVILGVTSSYGFPFDIALRSSFGYREMIVDVRRLGELPYAVARFRYPLSVAALQKKGYIPDGPAFEAGMTARQQERVTRWTREFEESALGRRETCPLDQLRGDAQAANTDPQDARVCNQRGIAFAKSGEYQSAIAEFGRAIRRYPTFVDAFYNRALVSMEIGSLGQAASDLGAVVEIRPEFVEGRFRRGRLYVAMNEHDKAISEFTKAVEIDPKCAEAIFHRSLVYFVRGDYEKALQDATKIEGLGQVVPTAFLRTLRGESDQDGIEISTSPEE